MSVLRIASRYAESLFLLAEENDRLDKVHDDVMYIWEVAKTADFKRFLKNPIISVDKKESVFKAVFAKKVNTETLNTLMIIAEHRRERYLTDFCLAFHTQYNKQSEISSARLITPEEVDQATIDQVLETFKNKGLLKAKVELETVVDPDIIGGFVLEFDDQVYDASVAYQLDLLETKFSENLYIKNF